MSALAEFVELKRQLNSAIQEGQYHLLMELDGRIRAASDEVFVMMRKRESGLEEASREMRELMDLYRYAIDVCTAESDRAKKEYIKTVNNKQGTARYLQVAGISYGNSR